MESTQRLLDQALRNRSALRVLPAPSRPMLLHRPPRLRLAQPVELDHSPTPHRRARSVPPARLTMTRNQPRRVWHVSLGSTANRVRKEMPLITRVLLERRTMTAWHKHRVSIAPLASSARRDPLVPLPLIFVLLGHSITMAPLPQRAKITPTAMLERTQRLWVQALRNQCVQIVLRAPTSLVPLCCPLP